MFRKWRNRSLHDKILISIARAVFALMLICFCLLDSKQWWMFLFVAMLCGMYLAAYSYANKDYLGEII